MAAKMTKETEKTIQMTGFCRFCGQTRIIRNPKDLTEEELTNEVTFSCSCEAGKSYRTRARRAEAAKERVDDLFGTEADNFAQPDKLRNFMKAGIDVINTGHIKKLTINIGRGITCKIEITSEGKIKVTREVKSVVRFEQ